MADSTELLRLSSFPSPVRFPPIALHARTKAIGAVEPPRNVMAERTCLTAHNSELTDALTKFEHEVVVVHDKRLERMRTRAANLIEYLLPRLQKLGIGMGWKIEDIKLVGSLVDGSRVKDWNQADLLVLLDRFSAKIESLHGKS